MADIAELAAQQLAAYNEADLEALKLESKPFVVDAHTVQYSGV